MRSDNKSPAHVWLSPCRKLIIVCFLCCCLDHHHAKASQPPGLCWELGLDLSDSKIKWLGLRTCILISTCHNSDFIRFSPRDRLEKNSHTSVTRRFYVADQYYKTDMLASGRTGEAPLSQPRALAPPTDSHAPISACCRLRSA